MPKLPTNHAELANTLDIAQASIRLDGCGDTTIAGKWGALTRISDVIWDVTLGNPSSKGPAFRRYGEDPSPRLIRKLMRQLMPEEDLEWLPRTPHYYEVGFCIYEDQVKLLCRLLEVRRKR